MFVYPHNKLHFNRDMRTCYSSDRIVSTCPRPLVASGMYCCCSKDPILIFYVFLNDYLAHALSYLIFKVSVSNIKLLFEKVTFAQCCHRNSWQSGVKLLSTVSFLADPCFTLVARFQLFCSWQFGISSFLHNSLVSAVLFMIVWCQQFCSWQFGVSIFVHDSLVSAVLLITVWCQQFCSW